MVTSRPRRRGRTCRIGFPLLAAALMGCLLVPLARADEEGPVVDEAALAAARRVLPSVVRIQWRSPGERPVVVERHGLVVDRDGWILLAGPVPPADGSLAATLADGRSMSARIWASDARTALTLVQVPVADLPTVALRDVDEDEAGGMVPRRLLPGTRVTMVTAEGALARGALRGSHRVRVLQPDAGGGDEVTCLDEAALNVVPSDLGAPWLDAEGRVVGLLVGADVSVPRIEGGEGERLRPRPEVVAAYAVPSPVLRAVWPLLRDQRRVPRAALGVWTEPLSDALLRHVCRDCGGRVVKDVIRDRAAERAGLRPNDIIRRVDGRPMAPDATLGDVLIGYRPGDRVTLGVLRAGEETSLDVVLDAD